MKDQELLNDMTKHRYFDALRMTEVYMERFLDVLYIKMQKAKEVPEWSID